MKSRMTAQSKANIKAAVKATLIASDDGYIVELTGSNSSAFIENKEGPVCYKTASSDLDFEKASTWVEAINKEFYPVVPSPTEVAFVEIGGESKVYNITVKT